MVTDTELAKRLNLVRSSPKFVLRERGDDGRMTVLSSLKYIPANSGVYWVGGTTVLRSGREVESVFRVDTDSGGSVTRVFWLLGGKWFDQQEKAALQALGLPSEQVFPFDWLLRIPLQEDAFH